MGSSVASKDLDGLAQNIQEEEEEEEGMHGPRLKVKDRIYLPLFNPKPSQILQLTLSQCIEAPLELQKGKRVRECMQDM